MYSMNFKLNFLETGTPNKKILFFPLNVTELSTVLSLLIYAIYLSQIDVMKLITQLIKPF